MSVSSCPFFGFACCILLPAAARAQGYAEGVGLSYELTPLQIANSSQPAFRADVLRANVIAPVKLGVDSTQSLLVGLSLEIISLSGDRTGLAVNSVYGLNPIVGYRRRLSPRVELTALALPALNSDLREVRGEDLT